MSVKDRASLKGLQTQLHKLEGEYEALKFVVQKGQSDLTLKRRAINDVVLKINSLGKQDKVEITEHAIIRYLERIKGLNIDDVKKEILSDQMKNQISVLGNGVFPANGFKCKVVDKKIVTIIEI